MQGKKKPYKNLLNSLVSWMENNGAIIAMRRGIMLTVPLLILGSFCILLISFPIPAYQSFIKQAFDGLLYHIILWIYNATMNLVSLSAIIGVSYSYGGHNDQANWGYYPMASISCYCIFVIDDIQNISFEIFNTMWLFTALFVTITCCICLHKLFEVSNKRIKKNSQVWVDADFHSMITDIGPISCVCILFVALKLLFHVLIGDNIQNVGSYLAERLFEHTGSGILGAIIFVFVIHVVWFFGIHGSNLLGNVSESVFEAGMLLNMEQIANGEAATHIFTKTFFDCFVLMGGSGTTICLLIALLLGTKQKGNKKLVKVSLIPSLFNINEPILFGLPVIFNPIMMIPFVLVPLVCMVTSGIAMATGLVPIPYEQVRWTTPVLFSGYLCTGSIRGSLLQVINIIIGIGIYIPFIRLSEEYYVNILKENIKAIKQEVVHCEENGKPINLMKGMRKKQDIIRMLIQDLRTAVEEQSFELHYQPQVRYDGSVHGIEALLRWKYPPVGYLYPPLVIELARMDNMLDELGLKIVDKAAAELEHLSKDLHFKGSLSVNISPLQFEDIEFCDKVKEIVHKYDFGESNLCFEITEQVALSNSEIVSDRIKKLRAEGISFHMDDFGMGHASMTYMQNHEFDIVKLDGNLIKQLLNNERSTKIIRGIQQLSETLGCGIIAEFVEVEEQKELLHELGCDIYQGFLYSRALPVEQLDDFIKKCQ